VLTYLKKLDKVSGRDWNENLSASPASVVREIQYVEAAYVLRDATTFCRVEIFGENVFKAVQGSNRDLTKGQLMAITSMMRMYEVRSI